MNHYTIWCNLLESHRDMEFARAVKAYLDFLLARGEIVSWRLVRRKFGFGPDTLGEFQITISANDLAQLDRAFSTVATRTGEVEALHRPVYSMVTDFRSALYRDFPDPERSS